MKLEDLEKANELCREVDDLRGSIKTFSQIIENSKTVSVWKQKYTDIEFRGARLFVSTDSLKLLLLNTKVMLESELADKLKEIEGL